jgi:NADH-quinone oxidoreductase subunit F
MEFPLTGHIKKDGSPLSYAEYRLTGGYKAVEKALKNMSPDEIIDNVKLSNLAGRGGAGFSTGLKWSFVPKKNDSSGTRYLIANADEMEPGTFKDRCLLEGNPHQLIEGMIISAYAIQAEKAYIFIRWAYKKSEINVQNAINEAYASGLLGKNILNSGFSLDIFIHISAGRYICGEETALINSLEGKRGNPRSKPPFPLVSGLFGRPTVVNNVETLSCIPHIIENGPEWFKNLSVSGQGGTKLYGISGRVKSPGLWELPLGITLGELINEYGHGMLDGYKFKGVLPGGASTDFLTAEHFNIKMDIPSVASAGSRLGTGTMIVLDDKTCPVEFIHNLIRFFAVESCGWCTPCREGLPWVEKILMSIENGKAKFDDLELLNNFITFIKPGNSFCAHAPGAMEPLQSGLKYFYEDFRNHIIEKKCPWKK